MRVLAVLIAIAGACDFQPAPKKAPPAATAPTTPPATDPGTPSIVAIDAGAAVAVAVADAPLAVKPPAASIDVSDQCVTLGSHVAEVLIEEAQDPSKKSVLIQERTKIVRRTAESCTRDGWNAELIGCYMAAKTQVTLQACRKPDVPAVAPPVPVPVPVPDIPGRR